MHWPQCHCAAPAQQALPGDGQLKAVATSDGQPSSPPPAWVQAEHAPSAPPMSALLSGAWPDVDVELQPSTELAIKIAPTSVTTDRMPPRSATREPAPAPRRPAGICPCRLARSARSHLFTARVRPQDLCIPTNPHRGCDTHVAIRSLGQRSFDLVWLGEEATRTLHAAPHIKRAAVSLQTCFKGPRCGNTLQGQTS
jgi:hypothetical protein